MENGLDFSISQAWTTKSQENVTSTFADANASGTHDRQSNTTTIARNAHTRYARDHLLGGTGRDTETEFTFLSFQKSTLSYWNRIRTRSIAFL